MTIGEERIMAQLIAGLKDISKSLNEVSVLFKEIIELTKEERFQNEWRGKPNERNKTDVSDQVPPR